MRNYLWQLTRYKQTWRMHARNLLLIALTVFSGDNSSFYTKSSSSVENLRYEEPLTSSSPVEKRKSRREESISSSKRSAKKKSAKQKSKLRILYTKITWRNWLREYFQDRKLTRSKGLSAEIFLNRLVWSPPKTGITSALRNSYFVNCRFLVSAASFRRL